MIIVITYRRLTDDDYACFSFSFLATHFLLFLLFLFISPFSFMSSSVFLFPLLFPARFRIKPQLPEPTKTRQPSPPPSKPGQTSRLSWSSHSSPRRGREGGLPACALSLPLLLPGSYSKFGFSVSLPIFRDCYSTFSFCEGTGVNEKESKWKN